MNTKRLINLVQPSTKRIKYNTNDNNNNNDEVEDTDVFHVRGKKWFLTYPQCNLDKETLLNELQGIVSISDYIVAEEKHESGDPHLHAYLHTEKELNIRRQDYFDVQGYHCNIQKCKNENAVKRYCRKEGNFITNMEFSLMRDVVNMARSGDVKGAFNMVADYRPELVICHGKNLIDNLKTLTIQPQNITYTRNDFHELPNVLHWEIKYKSKKSLWIHGHTNLGKTEYAKSLFKNALLVRHMDQLKSINSQEYDGIIFDDMSFTHWPRESVIHILDITNESGINVKHGMVSIPKGMPRVFTSNNPIFKYDDTGAIKRRVYYVWCDRDLRKNKEDGMESDESGTGAIPDCHWVRDSQGALCNITKGPQELIGNTNWKQYNNNNNNNDDNTNVSSTFKINTDTTGFFFND